jgi:hypothetical protein
MEYIKDIVFQQDPDRIIWVLTESGNLFGLTFDKVQEVIAWHKHDIEPYAVWFRIVTVVLLRALPLDEDITNSSFIVPTTKSRAVANQVMAFNPSLSITLSKLSSCHSLDIRPTRWIERSTQGRRYICYSS